MSASQPPGPGIFVPQHQHQPQYPGYPQQTMPTQQQYYPGQQPFPAPIQNQPPGQHYVHQPMVDANWLTSNFQNYLQHATSFHVKQKVEILEAIIGWEQGNKYTVTDQAGHKIFYVNEESDLCTRQCCGSRRSFTLQIKDTAGANVLLVTRPLDCSCCFGLFCPDKLQVSTPSGQLLGSVDAEPGILEPTFSIKNAAGASVLRVKGPMCAFSCLGSSVVFQVQNPMGINVGTISKEWGGIVREWFTDADTFHMSFPQDLDPAIKATCLGALFLIDYEYFERGPGDEGGGRRLFS